MTLRTRSDVQNKPVPQLAVESARKTMTIRSALRLTQLCCIASRSSSGKIAENGGASRDATFFLLRDLVSCDLELCVDRTLHREVMHAGEFLVCQRAHAHMERL
jgi:hypothetical protein